MTHIATSTANRMIYKKSTETTQSAQLLPYYTAQQLYATMTHITLDKNCNHYKYITQSPIIYSFDVTSNILFSLIIFHIYFMIFIGNPKLN